MTQQSFLGICPEKNMVQKDTFTPMFIVALFTIAKTLGSSLNVHQQVNGLRRCGTYIQ